MTHQKIEGQEKIKVQLYQKALEKGKYLAMGISLDRFMGNDLVFYCSGDFTDVKVSWNKINDYDDPDKCTRETNEVLEKIMDTRTNHFYADGSLLCEFVIPQDLTLTPFRSLKQTFHLAQSDRFYLLMAAGDLKYKKMQYHTTEGRWVSEKEINFRRFENSGKLLYYYYLHIIIFG